MTHDPVASHAQLAATLPPQRPSPQTGTRQDATDTGTVGFAANIEQTLAAFLNSEIAALAEIDHAMGGFAQIAGDCVLGGGKRLRPMFAYWGWRGIVGEQPSAAPVLPALAALELLHTFALVHDDVMDSSTTRRGRPTAHRALAAQHQAAGLGGNANRFGEAAAVLVGDLCLIWADRLLAQAALPAATLIEARRHYDQMRVETVAGQYLDVLGEMAAHDWSVGRALRVARYKTASYTVEQPLLFGAALAGLGRHVPAATAYRRYGLAVGEAFQLRDDLLGVYGDPATTGKPTGDDLRTGKPTVLLMLAHESADDRQRAELDRIFRPDTTVLDDAEVIRLADLVAATGAVRQVERMIEERRVQALAALDDAPIDPTARSALTSLAEAATRRRS